MKHNFHIGSAILVLIVTMGLGPTVLEKRVAVQAAGVEAPMFEVDPVWPKPMPNHWVLGMAVGVSVDRHDNIWIVHRRGTLEQKESYSGTNPPLADCCEAAPPVLEFDAAGNLIRHWGGPGKGYNWPNSMHGITVDYKDNVWIGSNGHAVDARLHDPEASTGPEAKLPGAFADNQILKFTLDGKFLMQIGHPFKSKGSSDVENLKGPAKTSIDPKTNEVYVADGYGNKRVIVFDAETGKYKRHWGAYGHTPDDTDFGDYNPDAPPPQQFRNPVHCLELADDGLLYVCDRDNNRIQVFKTDGTFVKEQFVEKRTLGEGTAWDIAFSRDPQQKYLYLVDGSNEKVHILLRDTLQVLTSFGDGGRQPGQFYAVHNIATDSKGNIYTTETYRGQRLQKFVYKGIGPVTKENQGVLWPKK